MTWPTFYLICFAIGFFFSVFSFLAGALSWHFHWPHLPHSLGHSPTPGHPPFHGPSHAAQGAEISPFNFITFTAFLAWFGGTGYLITRYASIWFALGLLIASASGIVGAGIVFLFMTKVLISHEENLDPADFNMVGVLGRISSSIREAGTGEIIYSQAGTRRACGARSEGGRALSKGAEVVVTRYEKGIAYVRRWEDMTGESDDAPQEPESAK